jgi:hypothetical protein
MNLHASQKSETFDSSGKAISMEVESSGFRDDTHHVSESRLSQGRSCHCISSLPRNPNVLKQIGDLIQI